jgi:2-oxoglutarate dehydrogenase E1 component
MTRQPKNEAFARTSFLHGANAAYIEEMQALYERNPGSVSDEWRHFFASLQEERQGGNGHDEPSWARPSSTSRTSCRPAPAPPATR